MNPAGPKERRLVPRWRGLQATLASLELASPKGKVRASEPEINVDYLARLERWSLNPSLVTAAELVEIAIVEGREKDALDAARRLVQIDKTATPLIHAQASALLARNGFSDDIPEGLLPAHKAVAARRWTRIHPGNPLGWVELSLHQVKQGHTQAAKRSMRVALALAPHDRHVLRSAARLILHDGDAEKAHDLIARNAATKHDPWLLAAEIALAEVAKRDPRFQKLGLRMLEDRNHPPRQLTELAGSVATEELLNGSRKKSRRSFELSMKDPTGSALAQGEWASQQIGWEMVSDGRLQSTLEASEAQAFHRHRLGDYVEVPAFCWKWADADGFSIRPFEFGSAVAGMIGDHDEALKLAKAGLGRRPRTSRLLNAMAFSLASSGQPERAAEYLVQANWRESDYVRCLTAANWGLIAYRSGDTDLGRKLYGEAAAGFTKLGLPELSTRAKIYLAREAAVAHEEDAAALLEDAKKAVAAFSHDENTFLLGMIGGSPEQQKPRAAYARRPATQKVTATFPSGETTSFLINANKK